MFIIYLKNNLFTPFLKQRTNWSFRNTDAWRCKLSSMNIVCVILSKFSNNGTFALYAQITNRCAFIFALVTAPRLDKSFHSAQMSLWCHVRKFVDFYTSLTHYEWSRLFSKGVSLIVGILNRLGLRNFLPVLSFELFHLVYHYYWTVNYASLCISNENELFRKYYYITYLSCLNFCSENITFGQVREGMP